MHSKPNFSDTTCKPRYCIAFFGALTITNPTDSLKETKATS